MKKIYGAGILILSAFLLHFIAVFFGIYDAQIQSGFVWFDNVLHAMIGAAFGLLWFWILERYRPAVSVSVRIVTTIIFVLIAAVLWELLELVMYLAFTSYATTLKTYSPSVGEATMDSLSNIIGAIALIILVRK
jgi:hypothetical protein